MCDLSWFDQKSINERIEQMAPEIRRRELYQLIGKPSDPFIRAQIIIEFVMMYILGQQLYAAAKRHEGLDYGPNRLAFLRGAAQKALEFAGLPPTMMFKLVAGVFFCHFGYSATDSRAIARWVVCLEITEKIEVFIEMGYRFPEDQLPYMLESIV